MQEDPSDGVLLELPTGYGKTRLALQRMDYLLCEYEEPKILIVVPRVVLYNEWVKEVKKWGYEKYLSFIAFSTYVSYPKHKEQYDFIIYDEAHSLSDRCLTHLQDMIDCSNVKQFVMLSATIDRNKKAELLDICPSLSVIQVTVKAAIKDKVLPDPKVYLIPLKLNNKTLSCEIIKNKKLTTPPIKVSYKDRFKYKMIKNRKIIISCTQQEYYNDITALIEWYKRKSGQKFFMNMYLRASGDRLKWLSDQKTSFIYKLLQEFEDKRTLTFCNGIQQTELLGKYCINSKNKLSQTYLSKFNNGKINHITACNMLNMGVNLNNCQIGIYANLNSSQVLVKQRLGRLLRHPNPIIIIPYYENTRDEELVNKMLEDYNPELVKKVNCLSQIMIK